MYYTYEVNYSESGTTLITVVAEDSVEALAKLAAHEYYDMTDSELDSREVFPQTAELLEVTEEFVL